uniref:Nicotinate phosphoribosyltransferase n=1 Tax=Amphora coffeiformis TaxID=265554 RepID=A0A7S3P6C8_9STRA
MSSNNEAPSIPRPSNPFVTALLTDLYQLTMAYAHWKNNRHREPAAFELFFRKNPFKGEFTVFAGLDECLKHLAHFSFSVEDVDYIKSLPQMKNCNPGFFDWLLLLDASEVSVYAMKDGTVCFPREPLLVVEAPLAVGQLLETTLLTLVNFPSLVATNASRMVRAATDPQRVPPTTLIGRKRTPTCVEFGLRRAQGPDGAMTASKYCQIGGFTGTSNVQAGKLLDIPISGTHAHAFVQAYSSLDEVKTLSVTHKDTKENILLLPLVMQERALLAEEEDMAYATTNDGELAAFIAYAAAFPDGFLCLIDTYDTLHSGLLNFIIVAAVLFEKCGYRPKGIRLDSGDLAYLSTECARVLESFPWAWTLSIVASNDINEEVLYAFNKQEHAINVYGIGTNLVTCQAQPALGCVYKLVELNGKPRIKLSQDIEKVTIPGRKRPYRLYGSDGSAILDVMLAPSETTPSKGKTILCRHPTISGKRVNVTPSKVQTLLYLVFRNGNVLEGVNPSIPEAREAVATQLKAFRSDVLRYTNPTPYKVSVSEKVFQSLHEIWQSESLIPELS